MGEAKYIYFTCLKIFCSKTNLKTLKMVHAPRNAKINGGIMRFSRSKMYHKKAAFVKNKKGEKAPAVKKVTTVEKQIGGEKNGDKRVVQLNKTPRALPTQAHKQRKASNKKPFSQHTRKLRSTITPGTVLILVAGVHKGKRVVFLKQLASGLLLVTGPFRINRCPLRRINQIYVIATKTKIDIAGVKLPENLNDDYFKRMKFKKSKNAEGDIFDTKKESYSVTEERKKDQIEVDTQILTAIKNNPEKKLLTGYLGAMFSLKNHQYPHKMIF